MEKGILVKTVEAKLAQKLDEVVKLNGLWESIDGIAFKLVISAVDDTLGEKIPEEYKLKIRNLISGIIDEGDFSVAVEMVIDLANEVIDVPGLDDEQEELLFSAAGQMIAAALLAIKKKELI